jgi:hypothetical protein
MTTKPVKSIVGANCDLERDQYLYLLGGGEVNLRDLVFGDFME